MKYIGHDEAIHFKATLDFVDEDKTCRKILDEWILTGPRFYV